MRSRTASSASSPVSIHRVTRPSATTPTRSQHSASSSGSTDTTTTDVPFAVASAQLDEYLAGG